MSTQNVIIDKISLRSLPAAVPAEAGSNALEVVNGVLQQVNDQGGAKNPAGTEGVDFNVAISPAAIALYRARLLIGNTLNAPLGTDFDTDQWHNSAAAIGGTIGTANLLVTPANAGVLDVSSTATATHGTVIFPHGGHNYVTNASTNKWYVRFRMQMNTAIDSAARCFVGIGLQAQLNNATPQQMVRFGVKGNSSTTAWYWDSIDNTGTVLGTATGTTGTIDNAWHTVELWSDNTNLSIGLDLGTSTVATATTPSTNIYAAAMTPYAMAYNGATAATRDLWIDNMYMVVVGN